MLLFLWYIVVVVLVWFLQLTLPVVIHIVSSTGIAAGWLVCVLTSSGSSFQDERALIIGLFCGFLIDISSHGVFGIHIVVYAVASLLMACQGKLSIPVRCLATASLTFLLLAVDSTDAILHLTTVASLHLWNRILLASAFNASVILIAAPLFQLIGAKIGMPRHQRSPSGFIYIGK